MGFLVVLKVLKWHDRATSGIAKGEEHWEVTKNFRVGRMTLNYSSVDVQWNPSEFLCHLVSVLDSQR
jgi:hypothetical protein